MGRSAADVIRDQYDAVNERDWERALALYGDDVEMIIAGSGITAGRFAGRDEVGRWFGEWFATSDSSLRFQIREMREEEDGAILVIADTRMRGRASGVELEETVVWRYRVRDGKIVRVEGWATFEDAVAEIGPVD